MLNGSQIRELRKRLGLTQAELGQLVGAHGMTVSKWELGRLSPTPYQSALLSEFQEAARQRRFDNTIKTTLVTAGLVAALYLLLRSSRG